MEYIYDAAGNKRRQLYYVSGTLTKTTDFVGNFVYENNVPVSVQYPEGRVVLNSTGTTYCNEAYIKDNLGNIRVACYYVLPAIKIRQVNSYYPFGMNIKELSANSADTYKPNEYLYNGKMMQDEMGLGWLDYGWRFYDPQIGRWHSVDPACEEDDQESWTPYHYVLNNPIKYTDPDGRIFGIDNLVGAAIGAAVDYGTQVATNYISGNENPWTDNINLTSIGTSAAAGLITSGASTFVKVSANVTKAIINNTVQVKTSENGLKVNIEKNVVNIGKNAVVDLAVNKVAGKVGGAVEGKVTKAGITNAGRLTSTSKAIVNATGNNVTRSTTATTKTVVTKIAKTSGTITNSAVKAATNSTKAEIKERTNL